MRVAVVHNRDASGVIDAFGPQNRKRYNPRTVLRTHIRSSTATVEDNVERMVETRTPTEAVDRVNMLGDWISR